MVEIKGRYTTSSDSSCSSIMCNIPLVLKRLGRKNVKLFQIFYLARNVLYMLKQLYILIILFKVGIKTAADTLFANNAEKDIIIDRIFGHIKSTNAECPTNL